MCSYYVSINELSNAEHYANLASESNPNNAQTAFSQGLLAALNGNIESAMGYIERVKFLDPSELEDWPLFGVSLLMAHDPLNKVNEQIHREISKDQDSSLKVEFLKAALGNLEQLPEASEKLKLFHQMYPSVPSLEEYGKVAPEFATDVPIKGMVNTGLGDRARAS